MFDRYIPDTCEEGKQFEVISKEMWEFLSSKYKFDLEVRRYYYKPQYAWQTQMDIRLKQMPFIFVNIDKLPKSDSIDFTIRYV